MIKSICITIFLSFISPVAITSTYAAIPPDIVVEDISGKDHNGEIVGDAQRIDEG